MKKTLKNNTKIYCGLCQKKWVGCVFFFQAVKKGTRVVVFFVVGQLKGGGGRGGGGGGGGGSGGVGVGSMLAS